MNNTLFPLGMRAVYQKDLKTAILEAKKNGFEYLEIHFSSPQFLPQNYTKDQIKALRTLAEKNNIKLSTHAEIGQSLVVLDSFSREGEKKKIKRMVDFSSAIGATSLTLHPGKASGYYSGAGKSHHNDDIYAKYYAQIFDDSCKHLVSIAKKNVSICIENTDNFSLGYQKVLAKYLKTGKLFLTWDIMKSYLSYKPEMKIDENKFAFLKKNIKYVRNIHVSGPSHAGIAGYEHEYVTFFKLLENKNIPMIIEILSLEETVEAKNVIRGLGF